jgi:ribosome-associated protein
MQDDQPPKATPSKTQRKHAMHALQELGERLVSLSDERCAALHLPEALREAVNAAKRIRSREGLRRQMQFIGRLMRDTDPDPIRAKLAEWDGQSHAATALHHRLERWRERLLADDAALTEFARAHPGVDLQRLRACVRETRKEQRANKPSRQFRELFRLIREAAAAAGTETPSI